MINALSYCASKFRRSSIVVANAAGTVRASRAGSFCEPLESRTLFNSVTLSNGVLNIQGSGTVGSSLTANLIDGGTVIDASGDNYADLKVKLSAVKSIHITGGSGADYIFVDQNIKLPVTLSGGNGNDQIRGGGGGNTIIEGNGNDWINAGGTSDSITVGNGNDVILGAGNSDTIVAGNGKDSINGSAGNDSITAGNGNDTINGEAGNDTIVAGNGNDSINGGLGNDRLTVGTGTSTVIPGSGTNYVVLGNTKDTVVPSAGVNTVVNTKGQPIGNPTSVVTTNTPSWETHSAQTPANRAAPQAIMQVLQPVAVVGIAVDVRAVNTVLGTGTPIDASYSWNFGDPNGEYNVLPGFNATHIYTQPGYYTITLTVENTTHLTSSTAWTIGVAPDDRKAYYVDAVHGSDNNNGLTPATAFKTAAKADSYVTNNTEIFFARGETFNLAQPFLLHASNVLTGAYGTGSQPVINYTAPATGAVIFSTNTTAAVGVTIQDLTFTTLNGTQPYLSDLPMAIMAGGTDTAVLRCTFEHIACAVNASGAPDGLSVEDSSSPLSNGLLEYFLWDQGNDTSILGNYANGSVDEHIVRTSSAVDILAAYNNFTNNDGKGCIEIHWGAFAWVDDNTVTDGDIRVGPLGLWGEPASSSTDDCVIENNTVLNSFIAVDPGAHDISIRNNIIHSNSAMMINVTGTDSQGRIATDIRILNNTGISNGATGNFLKVETAMGSLIVENNLLVEPNLAVGANNAGPVYIVPTNFNFSGDYFNGNVWQLPETFLQTSGGGINLIGGQNGGEGSVTAAAWNALAVVGNDIFARTTLNSSDAPSSSSAAATVDSAVGGVFTDFYGNARPLNGPWTAGAVQA